MQEVSLLATAVEERATREVLFREVNEHIAELSGGWSDRGVCLFVCECGDPDCAETLEIDPAAYERVRAHGARFVILAGHELSEVERVIESNDRFLVVEKVGAAAAIARAANPRSGT